MEDLVPDVIEVVVVGELGVGRWWRCDIGNFRVPVDVK